MIAIRVRSLAGVTTSPKLERAGMCNAPASAASTTTIATPAMINSPMIQIMSVPSKWLDWEPIREWETEGLPSITSQRAVPRRG